MDPQTASRSRLAPRVLPAVWAVGGTWLLLVLAQFLPIVCAPVNPCPDPDVRIAPALLFGGLILLPAAGLIVTAWAERGWAWWVRLMLYIMLVGLALVGLGAVLFAGGFSVGLPG